MTDDACTVLIDAMCAQFGGIATYVQNLLREWPRLYPDDDLHVLCPLEVAETLPERGLTVHLVDIGRPVEVQRPLTQTRRLRHLVRELRPDAVLATLPSTTLLRLGAPTVVVVYDLRHELRPEQFPWKRRLMRRISYGRGYAVADAFVAISARSLNDLRRLHPRIADRPGAVVHLGADHVLAWEGRERGDYAVAFGHHTNKNVDLVLDAWQQLVRVPPERGVPRLRITGLGGTAREAVAAQLRQRDLEAVVELMPFLDAADFERLFAGAGLVVFPSDFEGFGLPVVEGMLLGKPVVVGPDEAVLEVAGGHAAVMAGWTSTALADATRRAVSLGPEELRAARDRAAEFTWERTTRQSRAAVLAAARSGRHAKVGR